MLTRETVENIVECRLSDEQILAHLKELATAPPNAHTLSIFVDVLLSGLDREAVGLQELGMGVTDCAGTGGSGLPHFNTSTTVAFVLAAGGVKVAKSGNRAAQSQCGSFDLLEMLGIPPVVPPIEVPGLLDQLGLVFLFAPQYYPALARLAPLRKALGSRTIFNSIGPLLNPMRPSYRVMGISCATSINLIAEYLSQTKTNRRSILVRSERGLDELEPGSANTMIDTMPGYVKNYEISFPPATSAGSHTYTAKENHDLFFSTISGAGPEEIVQIVCLNAAAGFVASGQADFETSVKLSRELLTSGAVEQKVEQCRRAYARFSS